MLDKERANKILKEAIAYSTADETEILLRGGKSALTRFANNHIHQNVLQKDYYLTVKAVIGKRVGIASCNIFDGDKLKELVDTACEIASHSKEDHDWVSAPGPSEYETYPNAYYEHTIDFSPEDREKVVEKVVTMCKANNIVASGTISNGDYMFSIMNNKGVFAYHNYTSANFTLTATNDEDGTGWAEYYSNNIDEITERLESLTSFAIKKSLMNKNPVAIAPGRYTVILEEGAVNNLVSFVSYLGFSGRSFNEGRTFTADKMDQKIMGDNITIIDDASNKEVLGFPFDFEGNPRQKLTLIENGILKGMTHDRKTAFKGKTKSTGHALPIGSSTAIPINLVMNTGDSSIEEMIKSTENGVYITKFFYDNVVDEKKAIITGMTRDGTFLIKNGEIVGALKNMRYNEELPEMFKRVTAIARTRKSFGDLTVPALKVENFQFTGVSEDSSK